MRLTGLTQPLSPALPEVGYWTELEEALRLSNAQDRHTARRMNHDNDQADRIPFGSLPTAESEDAA